MLLEAFVDSLDSALAAEAAGADRLELCGPGDGGLSPSDELLRAVIAAVRVPVHAMIRPREGDFVYSRAELEQMRRDIETAKRAGAAGVVMGVLRDDNTIDASLITNLQLAYGGDLPTRGSYRVSLNVSNLFDEDPPLAASFGFTGSTQTNSGLFDVYGRRYNLGVRFNF